MEMNRMFVQVVNLNTGKMFSLPTLYADRTEACVCGQNYIRDRQAENRAELLFFRVLNADPDGSISPSYELWDDEDEDEDEDEDDCECPDGQELCFGCPNFSECWEEDEEDEEEEEDDFNWDDPACQSSRKQKPFELSDLCLEDLLHLVAMKAAQEDSEKSEAFDDPEEPDCSFE